MPEDKQLVTRLLQQWSGGDKQALDALMPLVYEQLRKVASRCLRDERPDHTLRATALVNEAYLRLVDAKVDWQDRVHFFAIAARLLGRILVDHAKARNSQRRGLGFDKIPLDEAVLVSPGASSELIELDEALTGCSARPRLRDPPQNSSAQFSRYCVYRRCTGNGSAARWTIRAGRAVLS